VRAGAAQQSVDLLSWLEIDFDGSPLVQSHDLEPYRHAISSLVDRKLAYPCELTRKQIVQAASAPHADAAEQRFPPSLRPDDDASFSFTSDKTNYRFLIEDHSITLNDQVGGWSTHNPFNEVGDFIIWTKLGVPAYQLAVVIDDVRQGVTDVVRGDDLLASAARQTLIYRALGSPSPRWWHLPLVCGEGGQRLAKRNNDAHLQTYRDAGVRPQRIIGLLARWCGITDEWLEMSAEDFRKAFVLTKLSREPVCFTQEDHAWLIESA
jgi:glutamyl-tRNA synthetase